MAPVAAIKEVYRMFGRVSCELATGGCVYDALEIMSTGDYSLSHEADGEVVNS